MLENNTTMSTKESFFLWKNNFLLNLSESEKHSSSLFAQEEVWFTTGFVWHGWQFLNPDSDFRLRAADFVRFTNVPIACRSTRVEFS